jgi:hypothetical protein
MKLRALAVLVVATGAAHAETQADCEFLEASASTAAAPSIDPALGGIAKKLKNPPFSAWNAFKLLSKTDKVLAKKKPETIALKQGQVTATFVEQVDKSQIRIQLAVDDASGKRTVNNTVKVEAGDWIILGDSQSNNAAHLIALTCK